MKRGNGLGGTPVEIPRKGRPNTWGVRTPLHFNPAVGRKDRYWIGREYKNKTEAEKALSKWIADFDEGDLTPRSDMTVGQLMDRWLKQHRGEDTTRQGYEPKVRLHIKPHLGSVKVVEVTDDRLDDFYRMLEVTPSPTNSGKPLGPKSVRHIHNAISAAFETVTGPRKLLKANPAHTANPPTERQIKAAEPTFPTLNDAETAHFLGEIWKPCDNRACDGLTHHCLRDAPLWTSYAATSCRRSEVLGWMWDLIDWDTGAIKLRWVVVEEGNTFRLRKLTKDGDDDAVIYVDPALLKVLRWQWERQQQEKARLGPAWTEHGLVFARDGFKLYKEGRAGGPQDPEKVSARWRTARNRLHLPEDFRLHDWRGSKITNDLDNKENPVEVSANARHHSAGYTMSRYGRRRPEGAIKLAASSAGRIGLAALV
ncbi:tyrosine-type recombinase/integrase [Kitasatospora sp. NPDC089913]|uniref:tyrosine-type recombinase/integrase n=1 Tax=Kitasatospora sp. NPDC089913 TaxID=3364080 RepID=UPI003818BFD6